jgi:hypothetical protein
MHVSLLSTVVVLSVALSAGCSEDKSSNAPAAPAAAPAAKPAAATPTSGPTTKLTADQLKAAKDEVVKHDHDPYDKQIALAKAKLGAPQSVEATKSAWYGLDPQGNCYAFEIEKSGITSVGTTSASKCGK